MRRVLGALRRALQVAVSALLLVALVLVAYPRLRGLSTSPVPPQNALALRGVHVVNPGEIERRGVTVIVRDGRFEAIDADGEPLPPNVDVLTHAGLWLVPGLIDAHVHVVDEADMALLLAHGVTTARNMLGRPVHTAMRDAVAAGAMPGPRLLTSGPTLNGVAQLGSFHTAVSDAASAREEVRAMALAGYDLIKVYDDLSLDVFAAIADEAKAHGLPVAGHPPRGVPLPQLLATLASVEHVEEIWRSTLRNADDQTIDAMAIAFRDADVPLVVTLEAIGRLVDVCGGGEEALDRLDSPRLNPLFRWFGARSLADWVDDSDVAACPRWQGHFLRMQRIVRRFHLIGATIAVGSDSGPHRLIHGQTTWLELNRLHQAGLTPEQVLAAATRGSARALRRESDIGAIRPGFQADAVLLRSDPRITLLGAEDIVGVLAEGRWYDAAALQELMARGEETHADPLLTLGRLLQ